MPEFYDSNHPPCMSAYLWPIIRREIARRSWPRRLAFDLGCGSGATAHMIHALGFEVTAVDISEPDIAHAQTTFPAVRYEIGSAYDDLPGKYGQFDLVVSLEVIEHCIEPRRLARTLLALIAPGGIGVLSCPYHGYVKNVALAVSGKMDSHFTALWDGGHVKFFSVHTLRQLLSECGANFARIERVGRIPQFAKSIVAIVTKDPPII